MDTSIKPVTPEIQRARGARAFDQHMGIDDHNMNPDALAIADWQAGWRQRKLESLLGAPVVRQQVESGSSGRPAADAHRCRNA